MFYLPPVMRFSLAGVPVPQAHLRVFFLGPYLLLSLRCMVLQEADSEEEICMQVQLVRCSLNQERSRSIVTEDKARREFCLMQLKQDLQLLTRAPLSSVSGSPKLHLRYLQIKSYTSVSQSLVWAVLGEGASLGVEITATTEPVVSTVNDSNSHSMSISILEGESWNLPIPPTSGMNSALLLLS